MSIFPIVGEMFLIQERASSIVFALSNGVSPFFIGKMSSIILNLPSVVSSIGSLLFLIHSIILSISSV